MFRLYAQTKQGTWDKIVVNNSLHNINKILSKLSEEKYYSFMVIQNVGKGDEVLERGEIHNLHKTKEDDELER